MSDYAAIFDMDGVLVDSYRAHLESWQRAARDRGLDMTEDDFAATFGRTSRDIIDHLWGSGVPENDRPAFDADKEAAYRDILRVEFPEMDGASELVAALAEEGFALAVGSSGPPENVQVVLEMLPHAENITATVTGADVTRGKPHPDVFCAAAEKLGIAPRRCVVLEDAVHGLTAAHRADMAAVAITGTAEEGVLAAQADLVVDSLRELTPQRLAALIDARA
ncbi:MAG: HAD family phosphatase [Phycisphaerae bacterium]|nr:HAD family phosphatase [Phycisphaerae bacterium]